MSWWEGLGPPREAPVVKRGPGARARTLSQRFTAGRLPSSGTPASPRPLCRGPVPCASPHPGATQAPASVPPGLDGLLRLQRILMIRPQDPDLGFQRHLAELQRPQASPAERISFAWHWWSKKNWSSWSSL